MFHIIFVVATPSEDRWHSTQGFDLSHLQKSQRSNNDTFFHGIVYELEKAL
jgi:hypothetical protein